MSDSGGIDIPLGVNGRQSDFSWTDPIVSDKATTAVTGAIADMQQQRWRQDGKTAMKKTAVDLVIIFIHYLCLFLIIFAVLSSYLFIAVLFYFYLYFSWNFF